MIKTKLIIINKQGKDLEDKLKQFKFLNDGKDYKLYCIKHGCVLDSFMYFSKKCHKNNCRYLVNYV